MKLRQVLNIISNIKDCKKDNDAELFDVAYITVDHEGNVEASLTAEVSKAIGNEENEEVVVKYLVNEVLNEEFLMVQDLESFYGAYIDIAYHPESRKFKVDVSISYTKIEIKTIEKSSHAEFDCEI